MRGVDGRGGLGCLCKAPDILLEMEVWKIRYGVSGKFENIWVLVLMVIDVQGFEMKEMGRARYWGNYKPGCSH